MSISDNIFDIRSKIRASIDKSGRSTEDIVLIGVSKTQSVDKIIEAREAGVSVFGENKVQELLEKYDRIDNVKWHFIGRLQRNKVKYIINKVDMIHSLDSYELAAEIDKRAGNINRVIPVLIQINIGKEESKSGILEEELEELINSIKDFKNIVVSGLMTIPPASDNMEETRIYFKRMKSLYEGIKSLNYENFDIKFLSMGMTDDFEVAVEEGANIVRIGTGIFGERMYKQEG